MVTLRFYNSIKRLEVWRGSDVSSIAADSVVRNELNGWRPNPDKDPKNEVVYGITQNPYPRQPVMPREIPEGRWQVYTPVEREDEYLEPYYIPTSAEQWLEVWKLDENGGYEQGTGGKVLDTGYGLHFSQSNTTVGCIKIHRRGDLLWLREVICQELDLDHKVWLEV